MKRLYLITTLAILALNSCYKFDPITPKGTISPSLAFPVISVDQNIENSLVLVGNPEINLEEEVPTWAKHKNVYFIDNVAYNLADIYEKAKEVNYIAFRLNVSNDFPSTGRAQLFFVNDENIMIDSLFHSTAFQVIGSNVNAIGSVLSRGNSSADIVVDQQRMEVLKNATKITVKCSASNEGVPANLFEYYLDYYLSVKLSVLIVVDINLDEQ